MNLLHLKYVVEVDKTRSINKAAENLFMSQPNLSRAIKELEETLGVTLFKRTSKGIKLTPQGEEFIHYAKKILTQVDEVEAIYKNGKNQKQRFSISVPRVSYISYAFTKFASELDLEKEAELFYKETNSMRAISNILEADYKLGIIRYQTIFEQYFSNLLHEKGLASKKIAEVSYMLTMSKAHKLAGVDTIQLDDLNKYIEIAHSDPYVPSLPLVEARKAEFSEYINKRIFVFERASQFELLSNMKNSFMWASKIPEETLNRYGLIQKESNINSKRYKDVLIYRDNYHFTALDNKFICKLNEAKKFL